MTRPVDMSRRGEHRQRAPRPDPYQSLADALDRAAKMLAPKPMKCLRCLDDVRGELIDCDGSAGYRPCPDCNPPRVAWKGGPCRNHAD